MKKYFITAAIILAVLGCGFIALQRKDNKMDNLAVTDPDLALIRKNFIEQEVLPHGKLPAKTRYLVLLASHVATQSPKEFEQTLNEALDNGISPTEAKETVYQTVPYAGLAKADDFILLANRILTERGVRLPLESQSTTNADNRLEKGIEVQSLIFGAEHISGMRATAPQELKHIQDYLSANCFGDYYTRGGLDVQTRELLTFATLVSLGGADAQVRAHVQGNLNVGNDRRVLLDTVSQMLPYIGYPRSLNGIAAINDITKDKTND